MHIAFNDEQLEKLKAYSENRKQSNTKTIKYSLELLLSLERIEGSKDKIVKTIIERKFIVPKNIPINSFYVFLYLLSKNFPKHSSKDFWTQTVYISSLDKTHHEVFLEIQDEYKNTLKQSSSSSD